jgi:hypothetical protein
MPRGNGKRKTDGAAASAAKGRDSGDGGAPVVLKAKAEVKLREEEEDEKGEASVRYSCDKCHIKMVQSEAFICLNEKDANWDWQGHLPLICIECYNAGVEQGERLAALAWGKKCKRLWLQRKWRNGEQAKRSRNKTFEETRQQLAAQFPGEKRKEFRRMLYERLVLVSAALASAIYNCNQKDQASYAEATKDWQEELQKKARDETYVPKLKSSLMPDEVMQNAHRLAKGIDEFYLCRFLDCLYVCRNTQWIDNGGQYCCPACGRQYRPWVTSGGRTQANKVLIVELGGKALEEYSRMDTTNGKEVASILKRLPLAKDSSSKLELVFPILWVETATQSLINRFKEIALGLESELEKYDDSQRFSHVLEEINKCGVPSLFQRNPFSAEVRRSTTTT